MHRVDAVLSTPGLSFADRNVWHETLRAALVNGR
jgi:hypothetical protein